MALLSLEALNDRVIGIENLVAQHRIWQQRDHHERLTEIDALRAETKRLGEAVIALSDRLDDAALNRGQLEARLLASIEATDERADQLESTIERRHEAALEHASAAVQHLEVDVGSLGDDVSALQSDVSRLER